MSNSDAVRMRPGKRATAAAAETRRAGLAPRGKSVAPARTQAQRSEAMRKRVLVAAAEVMRKRGYAGFRTGAVALAAGVSRGAMLHHFPKKRDLILATNRYLYDRALEQSRSRANSARRSKDVLDDIIADAQDFFFGDHFFSVLDIVLSTSTEAGVRKEVLVISREARLPVEAAWREVLAANMPEDVADDILALTLSLVRGFAMRRLWDNDPDRFEHLLGVWRRMVRAYLRDALRPEPEVRRGAAQRVMA